MLPTDMTLKASQAVLKMLRSEIERTGLHPDRIAPLVAMLAVVTGHLDSLEKGAYEPPGASSSNLAPLPVQERCGNVIHVSFVRSA